MPPRFHLLSQIPGQSAPPRFGSQSSPGSSTHVLPPGQGIPAIPPHACFSDFRHSPSCSIDTPAAAAVHAFPYVLPSQPQTGRYSRVQMLGLVLQTPCASGILHLLPKSQYWFASGQAVPAMPPQTGPADATSIGLHCSVSSTLRNVPSFG